jgi:hypothetical protein
MSTAGYRDLLEPFAYVDGCERLTNVSDSIEELNNNKDGERGD